MALETLKGVKEIGGFKVTHGPEEDTAIDAAGIEDHPIAISHDYNTIWFRIQKGPIKERGINGCQVDTLIHAARDIITKLDAKFPSKYNSAAMWALSEAIAHLEQRTKDREARGVEGTSAK